MKVGDYVRTISGISKIENIIDHKDYIFCKTDNELGNCTYSSDGVGYFFHKEDKDKIIDKSSPNIIDLIEVGDFIGKVMVEQVKEFDDGTRVIVMEDGFDEYDENEYFLKAGIVTREQFESMEYRIGE